MFARKTRLLALQNRSVVTKACWLGAEYATQRHQVSPRNSGRLLPLTAGKCTVAKVVGNTEGAFAMQDAVFGAWACRIPSFLWRGKRPDGNKMEMGKRNSPLLVASAWAFTVSGHRTSPKIQVNGLDHRTGLMFSGLTSDFIPASITCCARAPSRWLTGNGLPDWHRSTKVATSAM